MSGIVIMFFQSQAAAPVVVADGTLSGGSFMEAGFGG